MAIARLFLPLLILVGLALFALQNWLPVLPLVLAGFKTQPLPLAIWMLAAIVAGAATTVAVSTLFSLTRFTAVRRSNKQRPAYPSEGNNQGNTESRPFVSAWQKRNEARANSPKTRLQPEEDWDNRRSREEWDDWEEDAPRPRSTPGTVSTAQSEIRDRADEDWDNWDGYPDGDREALPERYRPRHPIRTDFEAKQAPATQNQSGSLYSVSYEKADTQRPNELYDADYRVIMPPFTAAPAPSPAPELDDEDWGFDDDDIPDEPRRTP
jgi:uncharacterized integral membrane protein